MSKETFDPNLRKEANSLEKSKQKKTHRLNIEKIFCKNLTLSTKGNNEYNGRLSIPIVFVLVALSSMSIVLYFAEMELSQMGQIIVDRRNSDVAALAMVLDNEIKNTGTIQSQFIHDYLSSTYLGKYGLVAILDNNGKVIVSTNDAILKNTKLKDLDIFKQAINGEIGSKTETIEDHKMFVSYHPIKTQESTWALVVIRSYEDSFLYYQTTTNQLYLTIGIIMTILAIFGLYVRKVFHTVQRLAKKLDSANKELIDAGKQKGEFVAMVTHELKTPLVPIKGYVELLLSEQFGSLNEKQAAKLRIIKASSDSLLRRVRELLEVQKIELGQLKLFKQENNLLEIINASIDDIMPQIDEKKVTITKELEGDTFCLCDSEKIAQVLNNLLLNSLDFVPKENGKIDIKLQHHGTDAEITIKDNGIGIEDDQLKRLFVKFYQADLSTTREHGGTGLGLSICKGIIENHGGKIWARSEGLGKGIEFHILLPIYKSKP